MLTVIGRAPACRNLPSDQTQEIWLARTALTSLAPGFTEELRQSLIRDLLGRLSAEKGHRAALNLNHWDEYTETRIPKMARKLLAERAENITAQLKANWARWNELARRVTRNMELADRVVTKTAWELWEGRTREEVSCRALIMNARDLLECRRADSRGFESLESMISAAATRGKSLDFPSHRLEDQDPLEILIAREEQRENNDELAYAIQNVRRRGNRWILQTKWWKSSGLAELKPAFRGSDFGGSPE